jgi:hypothetical protein
MGCRAFSIRACRRVLGLVGGAVAVGIDDPGRRLRGVRDRHGRSDDVVQLQRLLLGACGRFGARG